MKNEDVPKDRRKPLIFNNSKRDSASKISIETVSNLVFFSQIKPHLFKLKNNNKLKYEYYIFIKLLLKITACIKKPL